MEGRGAYFNPSSVYYDLFSFSRKRTGAAVTYYPRYISPGGLVLICVGYGVAPRSRTEWFFLTKEEHLGNDAECICLEQVGGQSQRFIPLTPAEAQNTINMTEYIDILHSIRPPFGWERLP